MVASFAEIIYGVRFGKELLDHFAKIKNIEDDENKDDYFDEFLGEISPFVYMTEDANDAKVKNKYKNLDIFQVPHCIRKNNDDACLYIGISTGIYVNMTKSLRDVKYHSLGYNEHPDPVAVQGFTEEMKLIIEKWLNDERIKDIFPFINDIGFHTIYNDCFCCS